MFGDVGYILIIFILMMASLWFMCVKPHHTVCSVCNLLYFICDSVKVYNKDREFPGSLVVSTLCSTVEGPGSILIRGLRSHKLRGQKKKAV